MRSFLTTTSRILVGVLFIVSGFIKANDPLGFSYKLDEYFTVFHVDWMSAISLWLSIFISVFEIAVGFALLIGARMRQTAWALLLMIVFFSFLTFYSAYFDVVKDCGCFGDALHLTPWQSFTKDVVLLVLILIIFFNRNAITPLFGEKATNLIAYTGLLVSLFFAIYTYRHLPVIDFRPYAIGKNISEGMKSAEERGLQPPQYAVKYRMKNLVTGKDTLIMSTDYTAAKMWEDTTWGQPKAEGESIKMKDGYEPPIHGFTISNEEGDYTQEFLQKPGHKFILVAYDITKTNQDVQHKINDFVALCQKAKIPFIGLTASASQEVDAFRHEHNSMFDYYYSDNTALKTVVRSNPGLVLLNGATVEMMWHYNDFPSFDEVKTNYLDKK
jgi:uncharacterized membrane protein YphA (DoxX/SURF4 family)